MRNNPSASPRNASSHSLSVHTTGRIHRGKSKIYGLKNLAVIIAFLSVGRFIIDNNREFGFLMSLPLQTLSLTECSCFLLTIFMSFVRSLLGFYIEARELGTLHICLNLGIFEVLVAYLNLKYIRHIYFSGWSMILDVVYIAKLISFHLVVWELRRDKKANTAGMLRVRHFLYFLVVPTLCFQLDFPMKARRSTRDILLKTAQLLLGFLLFVLVMDQYAIPSIYRIVDFEDVTIVIENIINLSISTIILFLIFFYTVFYCFLDAVADITLFYDSCFYQEWWNASSAKEFWALWNRPVYLWFKRHVYTPMISRGVSKEKAGLVIFTISGLVHEYVASISIKKATGWFLITMLLQVPLIHVTESFKKRFPSLGNFFFWGAFCVIGQPSVMLLYYRSLYLKECHT
ncbi:STEROL O-ACYLTRANSFERASE [Encephalitozoon cuniculi GB-M1]|uniref:O-acyltransferase n=2 Tax=Encephalitozoon cuniculi TaxID=6035 RepID=Q8SR71_ENCCU|nr:acyl-CoA cholesterol acyltransferase [Encephalitozoon cuniculi GB-M1]AGE96480.1 sterol o-acyltransferase [Encephalitozoon cuniculi]KMV65181.1 acyl-CoA cholesterol acyltransferase [Encephalitozoon cuniculi EcunIII-L]UYI26486.1 membrane-bound O-acyltransferase-like protein [Encephalitozoon cuniculi]CAD25749.1 STEROL O-ACYLTRANSFERASE [Encephalitozoon cuniculi GB-M1]